MSIHKELQEEHERIIREGEICLHLEVGYGPFTSAMIRRYYCAIGEMYESIDGKVKEGHEYKDTPCSMEFARECPNYRRNLLKVVK